MNRALKINLKFGLAMGVLLFLQIGCLFYYGSRKAGFHEDELYTYYSTNKTAGLSVEDRQWMEKDALRNDFVVLSGEKFRYDVVKQMQSWDVHPPVYYYIFHTACSLFPDLFSKWLGIGVNLTAYVISYLLLAYGAYTAASGREQSENFSKKAGMMAFLTCLAWGFCPAVISGVMFIRMYQWLTLFILLCMDLHLRAVKQQDYRVRCFLLPLSITVFLGFLTQYYYIIFHFFLGAGFCFYLLKNKKIKQLCGYAAACAAGLGLAICYYPASLSHIFRGYRGTEAVSEFSNASNTWDRLKFFGGLFDDYVLNGTLSWWLLGICLLAVTVWFLKKRKGGKWKVLNESTGLLLFAGAGYFFTVSKTALILGETSNRYQLPVYGIFLFLILYVIFRLTEEIFALEPFGAGRQKAGSNAVCAAALFGSIVILIMNGLALKGDKVFFLYEEEREVMEYVKACPNEPVVVFYNDASSDHVWWLSDELMEYDKFYMASQGNQEQITDKEITESSRLLVYVADYENKEECLEKLLEANIHLTAYEVVAQKGLWTLYKMQ